MLRALASHQYCGRGSNPGVEAICALSLLFFLSLAPRGFYPGTPVFPSPQKPTLSNSNSIWNARTRLNEFIWTPKCFVGKQITIFFTLKESTYYTCFHSREMRPRRLLCTHLNSPTSYPASSLFINAKSHAREKPLLAGGWGVTDLQKCCFILAASWELCSL